MKKIERQPSGNNTETETEYRDIVEEPIPVSKLAEKFDKKTTKDQGKSTNTNQKTDPPTKTVHQNNERTQNIIMEYLLGVPNKH